MSSSIKLDQLPFDVFLSIIAFSDVQDVCNLRLTCKYLWEQIGERAVWDSLYRTSRLPRPPGPHPTQSRQTLEDLLVRTQNVHTNLFQRREPTRSRTYEVGGEETLTLADRWLLTRFPEKVVCRDIDAPGSEEPTISVAWEAQQERGFLLSSMDCLDVTSYNGQKRAFLVLEQREVVPRPDGLRTSEMILIQVHIGRQKAAPELHFEEVYRCSRFSVGFAFALLSPRVLAVHWMGRHGQCYIWDIEDLYKEPTVIPNDRLSSSEHAWVPYHLACRTHLLSIIDAPEEPSPQTRILVSPINSVLSGDPRATASGILEGSYFRSVAILCDSVIDRDTGETEVVIVGLLYPQTSSPGGQFVVARLVVPPDDGANQERELGVHVQTIMMLFSIPDTVIMIPSWTGSGRFLYSTEDRENGELRAAEVVYDDKTQEASVLSFSIGDLSGIQTDFMRRYAELICFEDEVWWGRVCYTYNEEPDSEGQAQARAQDIWAWRHEGRRMLRVLDFS